MPPILPAFYASDSFSRHFLNPTLPACILSSAGRIHYLPPRDSFPSGHSETYRGYNETLSENALTLLAPAASQGGDDALSGHSTPPHQMGNLRCIWRVPLRDCVDAAPVVVLQLDEQGGTHSQSSTASCTLVLHSTHPQALVIRSYSSASYYIDSFMYCILRE